MSEILLCNRPLTIEQVSSRCGVGRVDVLESSCSKPSALNPFTPYMLGNEASMLNKQIVSTLSPPRVASNLTNLSLTLGGDNVVALAEITKKLQELNIGMIGASTTIYSDRMGSFARSVKTYQDSVMAVRGANSSSKAARLLAE